MYACNLYIPPMIVGCHLGPGGEPNARALTLRDPARCSRYAASPRSTSGSFGHGPKCQRRVLMAVAGERGETGGDHRSLVDHRVVTFL